MMSATGSDITENLQVCVTTLGGSTTFRTSQNSVGLALHQQELCPRQRRRRQLPRAIRLDVV